MKHYFNGLGVFVLTMLMFVSPMHGVIVKLTTLVSKDGKQFVTFLGSKHVDYVDCEQTNKERKQVVALATAFKGTVLAEDLPGYTGKNRQLRVFFDAMLAKPLVDGKQKIKFINSAKGIQAECSADCAAGLVAACKKQKIAAQNVESRFLLFGASAGVLGLSWYDAYEDTLAKIRKIYAYDDGFADDYGYMMSSLLHRQEKLFTLMKCRASTKDVLAHFKNDAIEAVKEAEKTSTKVRRTVQAYLDCEVVDADILHGIAHNKAAQHIIVVAGHEHVRSVVPCLTTASKGYKEIYAQTATEFDDKDSVSHVDPVDLSEYSKALKALVAEYGVATPSKLESKEEQKS